MKGTTQGNLLESALKPEWLNKERDIERFGFYRDIEQVAVWLEGSNDSMTAAAGKRILMLLRSDVVNDEVGGKETSNH
jgi:hypothetical protein